MHAGCSTTGSFSAVNILLHTFACQERWGGTKRHRHTAGRVSTCTFCEHLKRASNVPEFKKSYITGIGNF